jgi:hypothetical protein
MVKPFIRRISQLLFCLCFKPFAELISHHALEKAPGLGYRTDRSGPEPETGIRAGGKPGLPRALLDRQSPHWRLQDTGRKALAEKGNPLGRLWGEVITIVQPETLLKWHRRLAACKWHFSSRRTAKPGRPFICAELEKRVLQFAPPENPGCGYDRLVGALANLGFHISEQTLGNIPKRHGLGPAPERKRNTTWSQFIGRHKELLWSTALECSVVTLKNLARRNGRAANRPYRCGHVGNLPTYLASLKIGVYCADSCAVGRWFKRRMHLREINFEGRSFPELTLHVDMCMVLLYDSKAGCKA